MLQNKMFLERTIARVSIKLYLASSYSMQLHMITCDCSIRVTAVFTDDAAIICSSIDYSGVEKQMCESFQ